MTAASHRVGVLVVDDSADSRQALTEVVAHTSGFECVGAVASGLEALEVVSRLEPQLILLDVRMDGLDGGQTCRLLREAGVEAAVVLVSVLRRSELPDGVATCGAAAIVDKGAVSPRMLRALWRRLHPDPDTARGGASPL